MQKLWLQGNQSFSGNFQYFPAHGFRGQTQDHKGDKCAGEGVGLKNRDLRHAQKYFDGMINLYVAVYSAAINAGITTIERLKKEGLSSYLGKRYS